MLLVRRLVCLLLVPTALLSVVFEGAIPAEAQPKAVVISSYQISTIDGRSVDSQTLMAGGIYNVKFTLQIAAGIKNKAVLKTDLASSGDRYWSLTAPYQGIDTGSWLPGQPEISFDAVQGTAQFELQGSVPANYVVVAMPNGETLHVGKPLSLIQVSLEGGETLESRTQEVIDSSIATYRSALADKRTLIKNSKADHRYVSLVDSLVNSAKTEGDRGYTDRAAAMLQSVPASGWIEPQSSNLLLWILIGVLALLMVAGFYLTFKARNDIGFIKKKADDQAKRLEILASRVRGIGDASLAGEIMKVKKDLEELSD